MTKPADLREKTTDELKELEQTNARELWKARFSNYSNQLDDTNKIRRLRRDIARIKTLLDQRSKADAEKKG